MEASQATDSTGVCAGARPPGERAVNYSRAASIFGPWRFLAPPSRASSRGGSATSGLDPQAAVLADLPGTLPDAVKVHAQLSRAAGGIQVGFSIEPMAQAAEVEAAQVVGDECRRIGAI